MIWMALLMGLPFLGLALFWVYPWRVALFPYLILIALSGFFDWLMMRSMHLPVAIGRREMIGAMAVVLNWQGHSGQVEWNGEIWVARASDGSHIMTGDRVVIDSVSRLTLTVKPDSFPMQEEPEEGS